MTTYPGLRTVIMGPQGTGKSYSLRTLLGLGLEVFPIFTEINALSALADVLPQLHWKYIPPYQNLGWSTMRDILVKVNALSNKALQDTAKIEPAKHVQAIRLLDQLAKFEDNTGKDWGAVHEWGNDRVLVIDTLTGLNKMMKSLCVGAKPILTQPDWGVAMDNLHRLIDMLATETTCHIVITAHVEYQKDELTNDSAKLMVHTLGRKLAPVLFSNFGDVVLTERQGTVFYWTTENPNADLKAHHLPIKAKQQPSFAPLVAEWRKRKEQAGT